MRTIFSMTGFAVAKAQHANCELTCEIRSLNSRYLEIYLKLPPTLRELEDELKDVIRGRLGRGKINCTVVMDAEGSSGQSISVNEAAVHNYVQALQEVRHLAGIKEPLKLADLADYKDIFSVDEPDGIDDGLRNAMKELVDEAAAKLNVTRASEGENLRNDLLERMDLVETLSREVRELGQGNARAEFDKLYQRLLSLIDDQKIDRNRLEMELALISDRVDISEEVVRMSSHLSLFRENLAVGSPIGKKLNFILQEMHRESNTMSSKNTLIEISHRVVRIKEEIERIREQVQNIE